MRARAVLLSLVFFCSMSYLMGASCTSDILLSHHASLKYEDKIICSVTAEFPSSTCVGVLTQLTADPSFGDPEPNTNPIDGNWIIEGEPITSDDIGEVLGATGKKFMVVAVSDVTNSNFNESLQIEFLNSGNYSLQYYYNFTSCIDTQDIGSIQINALPLEILENIAKDVCYGEDATIQLDVDPGKVLIGVYEIDDSQEKDTFSFLDSELLIENIQNDVSVKFIDLFDTITRCALLDFDNVYTLAPFEPLSISNVTDSCFSEIGFYSSEHKILGGSGAFEFVNSQAGGALDGDTYISDLLSIGKQDTLRILDTFCLEPLFVFPLTNSCSCSDTTVLYSNENIYEACESDVISLEIIETSKSSNVSRATVIRTYEKVGQQLNFLDELIVEDEDNAIIPYNSAYSNGKNYFARTYITSLDDSGEVNYKDFCIDSSSQEIIFRFFQNPDAVILGQQEVCVNQSEVLYQPNKIQSNTTYDWSSSANAEYLKQNNQIYAKFLQSGTVVLMLDQLYFPQISATELSCAGEAIREILVTEDQAPVRSDIFLFEPNFLSLVTEEEYCIQWFSVDKSTGVRVDFGDTKYWEVDGFSLENFYYGVETKFPIDGECVFDGYCETTQFLNKQPLTSTFQGKDFRPKVNIFPNPARDVLTVRVDGSRTLKYGNLVDLMGKGISVQNRDYSDRIELDVHNLLPGVYFLQLQSGSHVLIERFVRE